MEISFIPQASGLRGSIQARCGRREANQTRTWHPLPGRPGTGNAAAGDLPGGFWPARSVMRVPISHISGNGDMGEHPLWPQGASGPADRTNEPSRTPSCPRSSRGAGEGLAGGRSPGPALMARVGPAYAEESHGTLHLAGIVLPGRAWSGRGACRCDSTPDGGRGIVTQVQNRRCSMASEEYIERMQETGW
jgi:hypothetical protein